MGFASVDERVGACVAGDEKSCRATRHAFHNMD